MLIIPSSILFCIRKGGGKQWQITPKNLPRMQHTRAIRVAWLGSGSCPNWPKGWIIIIIIIINGITSQKTLNFNNALRSSDLMLWWFALWYLGSWITHWLVTSDEANKDLTLWQRNFWLFLNVPNTKFFSCFMSWIFWTSLCEENVTLYTVRNV